MPSQPIRTVRLKVRPEAYPWLNKAAREVNTVFNWCNAITIDASDRGRRPCTAKFLTGFDLCNLSAGASPYFEQIGSDKMFLFASDYPHWQFDGDDPMPPHLPASIVSRMCADNPLETFPRLKLAA